MIRKSFKMKLYPDMAAEYEKRHNELWDEMKDMIHEYGGSNYSIFLDKETNVLYGYIELSDEELWAKSADTALRFIKQYFLFCFLRFGVMTPRTFERTPLKENSSSHAGAVMHTKSLDFGYPHYISLPVWAIIISCHSLLRVANLAFQPETRTERF